MACCDISGLGLCFHELWLALPAYRHPRGREIDLPSGGGAEGLVAIRPFDSPLCNAQLVEPDGSWIR